MASSRFHFHTLVLIFILVVLVALSTWILPGGEYERFEKDGRTLVKADSFRYIESSPQGIDDIMMAPIEGFVSAAQIIAFLFVIGGAFMVITDTGAIGAGVQSLANSLTKNPKLQKFFIPITMVIFSIAGSTFGMSEETMPFVLIFIPLAISLGYDSIVGTAIPFLGAAAGFAGAVFNPFTVGIAQSISGLPMYSGMEYRIIVWVISTVCMITFIMWYAAKIKKNPQASLVYDIDLERKKTLHLSSEEKLVFTGKHKAILVVFGIAFLFMIYGILRYQWYIIEIAAIFLALGIVSGLIGGMNGGKIADSFKAGAKDMMGVALIIGCAKAMLIIAQDGKILDLMLFSLSGVISDLHPVVAAQAMFVTQGVINFFVHSGSGQAALTMPVMAPLADVLGISRQIAVLAFQFGEGWINPILPTSGVTMGVLGLAGIPWERWFKWMLPAQIFFFILALLLLIPPFFFNYH